MTTTTTTLADFLLARIAEDVATARAAQVRRGDGRWNAQQLNHEGLDVWASEDGGGDLSFDDPDEVPVLQHLVRHDPARVLAECEAKRRIVELHYPVPATDIDWTDCGTCPSSVSGGWPCPTLRALALPYADHPDFQEAWRP